MSYPPVQYGVDVDGDGIADYMVTQGGYGYGSAAPGYAGYATTGYATTGYAEGYAEGGVTAPPNLPAGARYSNTYTNSATGSVIDRYVVPQQGTVPVRSVVPEQQQYQVKGQAMVPETRHIQVPKQIMVPVQETIMVPQVRTKMVPKMTTETKAVTVQKPVQTVQTMVRTVNKVIEGQKIVQSHQVIEYERPKMIQGRFLGKQQAGITEVGVKWTGQYYQKGVQAVAAASPVQYVGGAQTTYATSPSMQYVAATPASPAMQYVQTSSYAEDPYSAQPYGYTTTAGYGYAPEAQYTTNPGPYMYERNADV